MLVLYFCPHDFITLKGTGYVICLFFAQTREELRVALESEMRAFTEDRDVRGAMVVAWNHQEFEVCVLLQHWTDSLSCKSIAAER